MAELFAYTDGACSGNPGPGGWGVLMRAMEGERIVKERELKGGEAETTNNRMELTAALRALESLDRGTSIELFTDSRYLKPGNHEVMPCWRYLHVLQMRCRRRWIINSVAHFQL